MPGAAIHQQKTYLYEVNYTIVAATAIFTARNVFLQPKNGIWWGGAKESQSATQHSNGHVFYYVTSTGGWGAGARMQKVGS